MDPEISGEARRRKRKLRIVIKRDKQGRYITIKGKKYRIGKTVKNSAVSTFVSKKLAKPQVAPIYITQPVNSDLAVDSLRELQKRQEEEEIKKIAKERKQVLLDEETKKKIEKQIAENNKVQKINKKQRDILERNNIAENYNSYTKDELAQFIHDINPELLLALPSIKTVKKDKLIKYLIENEYGPLSSDDDNDERKEDSYDEGEVIDGSGKRDLGMSNFEIDKILNLYPEYLGCISHDEIKSRILPLIKPKSRGGFVVNTSPHNKPGQHWQAVYFDARPNGDASIDWFDSYGDPIDSALQKDIKLIAEKLNAGTYLKFKENKIDYQNDKSSNCGWFATKFLIDRFRGKPFVDATGWNDSIKGEKDIEKFKEKYGGNFGYVESFGEGKIPEFRTTYPPNVRKYITDTQISSIVICRAPIRGVFDTLLNIVSIGGWARAKESIGIDKALHLYMVINGNTILERNHVVTMKPGGVKSDAQTMNVNIPAGLTFKTLLEKTAAAVGPSLQRYDGRDNNCQVFLTQVLRANNMLTPELNSFINQDIKGIFSKLPEFVGDLAKKVTDVAHIADVVVNGQKLIK